MVFYTLISFSLYADVNMYVPTGAIMENAKLVAEQGWDVANKELIKHIEKNQKFFFVDYMIVDNKPFTLEEYYSLDDKLNFRPYFNEHYYALANIKLFESTGERDKAIYLYGYILSSLSSSYYSYPSGLGLIYRQVIEDRTVESMLNSIRDSTYTNEELNLLKKILGNNLILNLDVVFFTLENQARYDNSILNSVLRDDGCTTSILENTSLNVKMSEVIKDIIDLDEIFISQLKAISTNGEFCVFERQYKLHKKKSKEYEKRLDRYTTCELMYDDNLKNVYAKIIFYRSMNGLILYKQIQKRIDKNKEMIRSLEMFSTNSPLLLHSKEKGLIDLRTVLY